MLNRLLFACSGGGRVSFDALEAARRSFGTDEDILLVSFLLRTLFPLPIGIE